MVSEAEVAGLNQCDVRMRYDDFKSSTPSKEKVCSNDNPECWDGACSEPSSTTCPPIFKFNNMFDSEGKVRKVPVSFPEGGAWEKVDEDNSVTSSQQPSSVHDSDSD